MVTLDTSVSIVPASSVMKVREHHHEVPFDILVLYGRFLGFRMVTMDMSVSLVPAASVMEVREHHHKVPFDIPVNFIYNMSILGPKYAYMTKTNESLTKPIQELPFGS